MSDFIPHRELPGIERELEAIGGALDTYPGGDAIGVIAVGFARRARSLWLGIRYALEGPSDALVQVGVRTLIEILLLEPWLALNPDLHLRLWAAEAERQMIKLGRLAPRSAGTRLAQGIAERLPLVRIREMEARIAETRSAALQAGVSGISRNGSLVPSLEAMVEAVGTPMVREAYAFAYNRLSGFAHSGAGALGITATAEGVIYDDGLPQGALSDRATSAIAYASILELTSDIALLGISEPARELRLRMLV